jgi:hypothetical protein
MRGALCIVARRLRERVTDHRLLPQADQRHHAGLGVLEDGQCAIHSPASRGTTLTSTIFVQDAVSQAIPLGMSIVAPDPAIARHPAPTLW